MVALLLLAIAVCSFGYCALAVTAAAGYRAAHLRKSRTAPPVSVLKPLSGVDDGLEENLAAVFRQRYGEFEILFAVRSAKDPAIPVVEKLRAEYPGVPSRLIVTGEPPYANAKVYSLDRMLAEARYGLIVMSDSDVRVGPDMLSTFAAEFEDPSVGLATC